MPDTQAQMLSEDRRKDLEQITKLALEEALQKIEDEDIGPLISLADAAWDVVMGFKDPTEVEDYGISYDRREIVLLNGPKCTCPPDLAARGGFSSGCLVHA